MSPTARTAQQSPALALTVWEALKQALSPIEEQPRVVAGLEVSHQATRAGVPYVVVHNPAANTYLKLDPREFDLLPLMDGTHTVKELVVAYYQRHGVLALPRIAGLVRLLRSHHFLTEPPVDAYAALRARLRRPSAGGLLLRLVRAFVQSEVALRDVDTRLATWYRVWGWLFFTRPAALLGTILGLLGPVLFVLELYRERYDLFRTGASYLLGLVLLTVLGVLALMIHELGHALAVKHAGRSVRRAGLMLYYGLPTAYVDTTDVWMSPRRLRLLASFAGPWTGLVLGGVCALVVLLLPESPVGAVLFAGSFVFLVDNLLNFNPLLELDGYYLLVDLVERPMLRARALGFVRGPLWAKLWRRRQLTGEERFFALFGLASAAWSALALVLAVRFWELRLWPTVREAWLGGGPLVEWALLVVALLLLTPPALALWGLVRRLAEQASLRIAWLEARAAARRHGEALAALRAVPLWSELPEARLLDVARAMRAQDVAAGTEVVRQGEPGDRFYVIAHGAFEVLVDGQPVARLERGDYFGERALLNDAPRAATVLAVERARVFWLDQAVFRTTLAYDLATRARLEAALAYRASVAEMPLFRGLSSVELDLLLARLVPLSVAAGEAIVRQGKPGDRFYVVRAGAVEVVRDGEVLATLGPGEAFGEIALLLNVPRTATVRALEPTELLAFNAADFRDLLAGYCGRAGELERLSHLRLAAHPRLSPVAG
ncbi:MAG: cyclic nucleotide-binding domain-containing protein [Chloroflexi bacterium]|nr:cyclic nucleotide-binding domain-containing protein [Chloroflexota bacterium]